LVVPPIQVAHEGIFSIYGTDDAVFVAGGGDGAVPETTVSRIDVATNEVSATRTLETPCSCEIVAGSQFAFLGGNGADYVLELDRNTLEIVNRVELGSPARSLDLVDDYRVHAGRADGRIIYFDPMTDHVFPPLDLEAAGDAVNEVVPVPNDTDRADSWVITQNGDAYRIERSETVADHIELGFAARDGAPVGDDMWFVGDNQIARWDGENLTPFVLDAGGAYEQVVAVGDRLWVFDVGDAGAQVLVIALLPGEVQPTTPTTTDVTTPDTATPETNAPVVGEAPSVLERITLDAGAKVIGATENEVFVSRRVLPDEADNNNDRIERRDAHTGEVLQTLDSGLIGYESVPDQAVLSEDGNSLFVTANTSDAGPTFGISRIDLASGEVVWTREAAQPGQVLFAHGELWLLSELPDSSFETSVSRLDLETGESAENVHVNRAVRFAATDDGFVAVYPNNMIEFIDADPLTLGSQVGEGCHGAEDDLIVDAFANDDDIYIIRQSGVLVRSSDAGCSTDLTPYTNGRVDLFHGELWGTTDTTLDSPTGSWLWEDDHFVTHGTPTFTEAPPEVQPPGPPMLNGFGKPTAAADVLWIPINGTDDVVIVDTSV
jgi:hypothetical protein